MSTGPWLAEDVAVSASWLGRGAPIFVDELDAGSNHRPHLPYLLLLLGRLGGIATGCFRGNRRIRGANGLYGVRCGGLREPDAGLILKRYFRRERRGLRNRTPSPVPFSSMNSMPAVSKACRIAASLASVTGISPSTTSTRRIVATPTLDAAASSSAVHRSMARAARI